MSRFEPSANRPADRPVVERSRRPGSAWRSALLALLVVASGGCGLSEYEKALEETTRARRQIAVEEAAKKRKEAEDAEKAAKAARPGAPAPAPQPAVQPPPLPPAAQAPAAQPPAAAPETPPAAPPAAQP